MIEQTIIAQQDSELYQLRKDIRSMKELIGQMKGSFNNEEYIVLKGGEYPVGHCRFDEAGVGHLTLAGVVYEIRTVAQGDSPGVRGELPPITCPSDPWAERVALELLRRWNG